MLRRQGWHVSFKSEEMKTRIITRPFLDFGGGRIVRFVSLHMKKHGNATT